MKLEIEKWNDCANMLSINGNGLFQESIVCYKNGAYRSAYIMSYLAFMITIKDRVLTFKGCPDEINTQMWREIINDLSDDNSWEECILNLLSKQSFETEFLICVGKSSVNKLKDDLELTEQKALKENLDKCLEKYIDDNEKLDKIQNYTLSFKGIKVNGKEKSNSKKRRNANIFKSTDADFLAQLNYYRTIRNQCAHYKVNAIEFGACNVEIFWTFMKSYLPKLQIGGALEYWKEKIKYCYMFYKDEENLLNETFTSLKASSFQDDELMEIWNDLLKVMKIEYDGFDNKVKCDFGFLKFICTYDWSRNSFIKCILDDFNTKEAISTTTLGLVYKGMGEKLKPYISGDTDFWKGKVYDKLISSLEMSNFFYDYLYDLWYDLINDLSSNKEKQLKLLKSMTLRHLKNVNEYSKYTDGLNKISYFKEIAEDISKYLPFSITNINYSTFSSRWNDMVDINLWAIENLLSQEMEYAHNQLLELSMFLMEIKKIFENEPDYYIQHKIAVRIIKAIEGGEYPIIKGRWDIL